MNILEELQNDHRTVQAIIEDLKKSLDDNKKKIELFNKFAEELIIHTKAEEVAFYDVLLDEDNSRQETLESEEEHTLAEQLIEELQQEDLLDEEWNAKCIVLCRLVNNHIEHEEEELFKVAKKVLSKEDLEECAANFEQEKSKIKEAA